MNGTVSNTSTGAVSHTLSFTYDAEGSPQTVTYNGTVYFYATNLQGDIVAILNASGETVVSYSYDAWGYHTSGDNGTGTLASTLGTLNPLRYRGYVYDTETGLYYLQCRYYNPEIGRFINADNYPTTGQGLTGNNMFVYCGNNPTIRKDDGGESWRLIGAIVGAVVGAVAGAVSAAVTGGSVRDVVKGAISCGVTGFIIGATADVEKARIAGRIAGSAVSAVYTYADARHRGLDVGASLLCATANFGLVYGAATLSSFAGNDRLASTLSDITFGTGATLVGTGTSILIEKITGKTSQIDVSTEVSIKKAHGSASVGLGGNSRLAMISLK